MGRHVFLSHASQDGPRVARLVRDLEARGVPCWISSRDIGPGEDYQRAIVAAIEGAAAVLVALSAAANRSREVPKELALASAKDKPILPARLEDVQPAGPLLYQLANAQYMDLFRGGGDGLERLVAAVQRLSTPAGAPAGAPAITSRRRRLPWIAVAVGALACVAVLAWRFWPRPASAPPITGMSVREAVLETLTGAEREAAARRRQLKAPAIAAAEAAQAEAVRRAAALLGLSDTPAARWSSDCGNPANTFAVSISNGSVTWRRPAGSAADLVDQSTEYVEWASESGFRTRTVTAVRRNGRADPLGSGWYYTIEGGRLRAEPMVAGAVPVHFTHCR